MTVYAAELVPVDFSRPHYLSGHGMIGGLPPDPADPNSPDGRFRIKNVPSRGRIVAYDRGAMSPVASTLSASDGTWSITGLNESRDYVVIGYDDTGANNAAIQDWVRPVVAP